MPDEGNPGVPIGAPRQAGWAVHMALTIKDIAKAANVSKAAVSYVINGKPGVSEETRRRIVEIMRQANFRPNATARGLAGQRTEMLGLVIPDITDMFYANIVRGVENKANDFGYTLNLCTTHAVPSRERDVLDIFTSGRVDGVILMAYSLSRDYLEKLKRRGVPFVLIDSPVQDDSVFSIAIDNEDAGYQATEYLIELGHKEIAFIHGSRDSTDSEQRFAGYCRALQEHGLACRENLVKSGQYERAGGYQAAKDLLRTEASGASGTSAPTAVFAANDQMALGVLAAAQELGLRVPEDLSIIGVDDIEAVSLVNPPLTTVRQPMYEVGVEATEALVKLIKGEEVGEWRVLMRTTLVVRESSAAVRGE